jgi:subtilisin family serine protease
VAVVDTGVDYTHSDLSPNIWINSDEIPDDGIDNDNNNYIDDYYGWDFVDNDGYPMPSAVNGAQHGTMMAGIIGAAHNNTGIDGINEKVQIMPIRARAGSEGIDSFLPCNEGQYPYNLALGIKYAADNGANVINLSLSTSMASQWLGYCVQEAVWYADKKGVVIVAASGNRNENSVAFPASMKQVIAVGAIDEQDRRLSIGTHEGSNYGKALDVVAPGIDIWTTTINNQYKKCGGTSLATAQVSGLAALLFAMEPPLSADQVRSYIEANAQKIDGYQYTEGWNEETGWGCIDIYRTLSAASLNSQVSALQ